LTVDDGVVVAAVEHDPPVLLLTLVDGRAGFRPPLPDAAFHGRISRRLEIDARPVAHGSARGPRRDGKILAGREISHDAAAAAGADVPPDIPERVVHRTALVLADLRRDVPARVVVEALDRYARRWIGIGEPQIRLANRRLDGRIVRTAREHQAC